MDSQEKPKTRAELPADVEAFLRDVEARANKATPGPIDVHRIDECSGVISYQLQQSPNAPKAKSDRDTVGARVLTQYDDLDNPDACHDAEFHARAHVDIPRLIAIVREQEARVNRWKKAHAEWAKKGADVAQELYDRAIAAEGERDVIRDRLVKLETAASGLLNVLDGARIGYASKHSCYTIEHAALALRSLLDGTTETK